MEHSVLGIIFFILILIGDIESSFQRFKSDVLVENLAAVAESCEVGEAHEGILGSAGHVNIHILKLKIVLHQHLLDAFEVVLFLDELVDLAVRHILIEHF
jgi:hypothetical protein